MSEDASLITENIPAGESAQRVKVLVSAPLPVPLDYLLENSAATHGAFVRVPLSGGFRTGVIWDSDSPLVTVAAGSKVIAESKLKPVAEMLDAPPLPEVHRRFIEWVADYTVSIPGAVLRMSLGPPAALQPPPVKTHYVRGGELPPRMTPPRERLMAAIEDDIPRSANDLADLADVGEGVVRGMIKSGALLPVEVMLDKPLPEPDPMYPGPALSLEQEPVALALRELVAGKEFYPVLLEGVTGSGKTEVYFEAIAEALLAPGAQVLVLLPEIALTAQWLSRFEKRFGVRPAQWHSGLGAAERRRTWRQIAEGHARVVVGARSALFLPYRDLGLIVLDEEHDTSFKQEEGVMYHARDMAVVRAKLGEITIILSSATPSFETVANVRAGRYLRFHLPSRFGGALLPELSVVDMRADAPPTGRWLSPPVERAIAETLEKGQQALLFLNRRGYAPLTLCRTCGERINCPNCTAWMVEHRFRAELLCHHCGHRHPVPEVCPNCETEHSLVTCGPGVERLEEELKSFFPEARIMVMASDMIAGPELMAEQVARIEAGAVDIIVGTQIITKGYHFPMLTLVGVIDADLGLRGADPRASERTYQQLSQVAGRAGRAEHAGRVMLQTFMPEHPVVAALVAGDAEAFADRELALREEEVMPPYGRLAALIVSSLSERDVDTHCRHLSSCAPRSADGVLVLGPAPAPLAMLRGQHRRRFLLKSRKGFPMQAAIRDWLRRSGQAKGVRVKVDIDPHSFL